MNNAAQPKAPEGQSPSTPTSNPIPSVDLKAPLKIETEQKEDLPQPDYGKKLFFAGLIFCAFIIVSVVALSFFWTQNSNQTQQTVTVEQYKK